MNGTHWRWFFFFQTIVLFINYFWLLTTNRNHRNLSVSISSAEFSSQKSHKVYIYIDIWLYAVDVKGFADENERKLPNSSFFKITNKQPEISPAHHSTENAVFFCRRRRLLHLFSSSLLFVSLLISHSGPALHEYTVSETKQNERRNERLKRLR